MAQLLNNVPDAHIEQYDLIEYKFGNACSNGEPNVLIISSDDASNDCLMQFKKLKVENPDITGVVLTNKPYEKHEECWKNVGVEYFFDKSTEFEKVLDVCKACIQPA
jgi:hypothetical protein